MVNRTMTSTSGKPFCEHECMQLCPQRARSTQATPPPAELRRAGFRGKNGQRMSLLFRVVAHGASASASRADWLAAVAATCVHGGRRASRRRVVAPFVVPLVISHIEAANVVASR